MDLRGSLVDTNLRIYPSTKLLEFCKSLPTTENVPTNILALVKGEKCLDNSKTGTGKFVNIDLNNEELEVLKKIKKYLPGEPPLEVEIEEDNKVADKKKYQKKISNKNHQKDSITPRTESEIETNGKNQDGSENLEKQAKEAAETKTESQALHLNTEDIDWLFTHLQTKRKKGDKDVPYLHILLKGSTIDVPENQVMKRNPVLEARCVKLRAQQEAREYRSMTKGVDNVRIRYPEDSINYQLKQMNRQLIAIGQFILSIFAGFLFGFRGIEWMVGTLDFGFRLLLGVMCALVIALAEIYFLAKKLNEELNLSQTETIQLGGPPKLLKDDNYTAPKKMVNGKEHQD